MDATLTLSGEAVVIQVKGEDIGIMFPSEQAEECWFTIPDILAIIAVLEAAIASIIEGEKNGLPQ